MFAVIFPASDALKLLVFLAAAGGLLGLGRWSSRLGITQTGDGPADAPTPDARELAGQTNSEQKIWPPSAEEVAASLPYDPLLGRIQIKKLFFDKTDISPGPPEPEVFADDLHIELYDPGSNHRWWQSFFIATPQGLARILRERHWRYLHAPSILVLPRYDLEEIRRAVVSRIVAEHDYYTGLEKAEEESL
jgi:hypothetical protein